MFTSSVRFLASLVVVFVLLTYMWVSAASAQTLEPTECTYIGNGVVACEGSALPSPPRGTVKHRPATSITHRIRAALVAHRDAQVSERVGTTEIIARLGAR